MLRSWFGGTTGYEDISSVLPGERVAHHESKVDRTFFWNPVQLGATAQDISGEDAVKSVPAGIVQACIHAWASNHDQISLQLSGGLDSAIVAACLKSAPTRPSVICTNFYSRHGTSDERRFAREVAAMNGFELIELPEDKEHPLDFEQAGRRAVIPSHIEHIKGVV